MAINRNGKTADEIFGFRTVLVSREEFEAMYPAKEGKATTLIDRIGEALLLEPMTREDLSLMLHETPKNVCRELRHLIESRLVATTQDHWWMEKPIYYLTRPGRDWAQGAVA